MVLLIMLCDDVQYADIKLNVLITGIQNNIITGLSQPIYSAKL